MGDGLSCAEVRDKDEFNHDDYPQAQAEKFFDVSVLHKDSLRTSREQVCRPLTSLILLTRLITLILLIAMLAGYWGALASHH